jgi:hypothetical protein
VIGVGAQTLSISPMNNPYYAQAESLYFKVTIGRRTTKLGDIYNILQPAFTTVKKSLFTNISISMTISATQTPNIYLRNYANTAIFLIDNIFTDKRINSIFIKSPADVTIWDVNYCNASLTGTLIFNYPLRFICKVSSVNSSFLQIIPDS